MILNQSFINFVRSNKHQKTLVEQEDGTNVFAYDKHKIIVECISYPQLNDKSCNNHSNFGSPASVMELSNHLRPCANNEEDEQVIAKEGKTHS